MIIKCKTFITFNDPFNVFTSKVDKELEIEFPKSNVIFSFPIPDQIPVDKYEDLVEEVLSIFSEYWDCEYLNLDSIVEDAIENIKKGNK